MADWRPATNGNGKHRWFLFRDAVLLRDRYSTDSRGRLIWYASYATAQSAAQRLNIIVDGGSS